MTVAVKKYEQVPRSSSRNETNTSGSNGNKEINALFFLRHANVARLLGLGNLEGERHLIMEYYPRCLANEISEGGARRNFLNPAAYIRIAEGIISGLRYVHFKEYIHGDLKPEK